MRHNRLLLAVAGPLLLSACGDCAGTNAPSSCCGGYDAIGYVCGEYRCNCGDGACFWEHTLEGCADEVSEVSDVSVGPYPFSQVTFRPTDPPAVTGSNDLAAFVPDFCASLTSVQTHTLDCPALESLWPCLHFLAPTSSASALTPAAPLLESQITIGLGRPIPEECQSCERSLGSPPPSDDQAGGPFSGACRSLVVLDGGVPLMIDTPEAMGERFAPVETAAEALAFAELLTPWAATSGPMVRLFKAADLTAAGFPLQHVSTVPVCLNQTIDGTEAWSTGDGWGVRVFTMSTACDHPSLTAVHLHVSTQGVVTVESREKLCWYEHRVCFN